MYLPLILAAAAAATPAQPADGISARGEKALGLFTVVTFPNDQCSSNESGIKGTCYTTTECSDKGGTSKGNCGSGFGVCCVFEVAACGGTVSQNCSYVSNSGYPSTVSTASQTCTYTVNPVGSDICQFRLDFVNFDLPITASSHACNGALTITSTTGKAPPSLCGINTGYHVYVENAGSTASTSLAVTTGTGSTSRSWRIKVTQLECYNLAAAPADCTQYYTGVSGNFQSFDFTGGNFIGGIRNHNICFRREAGYCHIDYKEDSSTSPDAFSLDANSGVMVNSCAIGRLQIMSTTSIAGAGFHCGTMFGSVDSDTVASTVRQSTHPFRVGVAAVIANTSPAAGFNLVYTQVPC